MSLLIVDTNQLNGTVAGANLPLGSDAAPGAVQGDGATVVVDPATGIASSKGFSGSIALAALTPMGTQGSITVVKGLITAVTQAT